MNQVEYDALLQQVLSTATDVLPGVSIPLRKALGELKEQSAYWRGTSVAIAGRLLVCPSWPSDARDKLIAECAIPSWQRLELQPQSPVYNATLLFGNGSKPGILESPRTAGVIIVGLEHLTEELTERWIIHLNVWWKCRLEGTGTPPHIMLTAENGSKPALRLAGSGLVTIIQFPSLPIRREDIVHLIHAEAARVSGSLTDFEPDAIDVIREHQWQGDWVELRALVNHLYENAPTDSPGNIDREKVRYGLENIRALLTIASFEEPHMVWDTLRSLGNECDTLTHSLLNKAFFNHNFFENNPLDCPNPQMRLSRLISWGYTIFVDRDGAADMLNALNKLPLSRSDAIKDIKGLQELLQNWRTLEQHAEEKSARGDRMRRFVAQWCEKACGNEIPTDRNWERCVNKLLSDLRWLFTLIVQRLRLVFEAEERDTLSNQWRELLEMSWPKHKHDALLHQVLSDLDRTELLATAVGEDLLKVMQRQLTFYSPTSDRERHMRSWLEDEILRRFPRPPVTGGDLAYIGVPLTQREYWLRRCNRLFHEQGKERDELLQMVKSELGSVSSLQTAQNAE